MSTPCPSEHTLWAVAGGMLAEHERAEIGAHIDHCDVCRAVVVMLMRSGDDDDTPPMPRAGTIWAERYELTGMLGQGGMGAVHAAWDRVLQRDVALKVLRFDPDRTRTTHEDRLVRESRAMARLRHPNVVTVYDAGTWRNRFYLAMELVEGGTLRRWLDHGDRSWRESWPEIVEMFRAAGEGLAAAHEVGLVHRDFKPDNVLIDASGRPMVADFGLARQREPSETRTPREETAADSQASADPLTLTGAAIGTPRYMAPEQRRGEALDDRADVFSFCVALGEALGVLDPSRPRIDVERSSGRRIPKAILALLREGLQEAPHARPSLRHLLDRLSMAASRARGRTGLVVAATLGSVVIAAGAMVSLASPPSAPPDAPDLCALARDELAEAWTPASRASLQRAWGQHDDRRVWSRLESALSAQFQRLDRAYARTCDAADAPSMRTSLACLELNRIGLDAVITLVSESDPRAAEALDALRPPRDCDQLPGVAWPTPPADEPGRRDEVARIRRAVVPLRTLRDAGYYARAREGLELLQQEARSLAFVPLDAELSYELGMILSLVGDGPGSAAQMRRAAQLAAGAHHDTLAANAWIALVHTTCEELHDYSRARDVLGHARAAVTRLGPTDAARRAGARLAYYEAVLAWREGRHDVAMGRYAEVIERAEGLNPELVTNALEAKGILHVELGQHAEALEAYREVLRRRQRLYGDNHPTVAEAYSGVAMVHFHAGRHREALPLVRRSKALKRAMLGSNHPYFALDAHLEAQILLALERFDEAAEQAARARQIMEQTRGTEHIEYATMLELEGTISLQADRPDEAIERLSAALEIYERAAGVRSPPTLSVRLLLAQAQSSREPERAAEQGLQVIEDYVELHGEGHLRVTNARMLTGELLLDAGRFAEARAQLTLALRDLDPSLPVGYRAVLRFLLARTLVESKLDLDQGRRQFDRAREELAQADESFGYLEPLMTTWREEHPGL